jgi:hypothetical protein
MGESILWELRKLRRYMGGAAGATLYILGVALLGIAAPLCFGFALVNVRVLLMYAFLGLLLAPPVVAESVASERELRPASHAQRRDWLYGKVGAGALYGWISVAFILALAIASLRVFFGRFLSLPAFFAVGLASVSLASSMFAASLAAAVAMGARTAKDAKRKMRQGLLLLLVILLFLARQPWAWTHRFAVPEIGSSFLEFALVISVVLVGLAVGLVKLALHSAESIGIRLNL